MSDRVKGNPASGKSTLLDKSPLAEAWPALPFAAWQDTYETLHRWMQIVGKIRLACSPKMNQWWNVPFYLTTRGMTTSPMPYGDRTFSIDFDFIDHELLVETSDGDEQALVLVPRSVADFHHELFGLLGSLGIDVHINPVPVEIADTTPFYADRIHFAYDAAYAHRFWTIVRRIEPVFEVFRSRFRGKCSPVHFFWGSFDLAVTRFSGRRAPRREGADRVTRDSYDEEVCSLGFWPGDAALGGPVFYAYTVPEPPGLRERPVEPEAAFYSDALKEFLLPYDALRAAAASATDPMEMTRGILDFAESTYQAGAILAEWDVAALAYPG